MIAPPEFGAYRFAFSRTVRFGSRNRLRPGPVPGKWHDLSVPAPTDFAFRATKDGRVLISRDGRRVAVLARRQARQFKARVARANGEAAQLLMARATGNYRRGNERRER